MLEAVSLCDLCLEDVEDAGGAVGREVEVLDEDQDARGAVGREVEGLDEDEDVVWLLGPDPLFVATTVDADEPGS